MNPHKGESARPSSGPYGASGRVPRVAINSIDLEDESEEDEDHAHAHGSSSSSASTAPGSGQQNVMTLTPSCVQDFSEGWVLFIMQQYYENNFNEKIREIGKFTAECANKDGGNNMPLVPGKKSAADVAFGGDGNGDQQCSQHILSQAFKVMVDVPDPPTDDAEKENVENEKNAAGSKEAESSEDGAFTEESSAADVKKTEEAKKEVAPDKSPITAARGVSRMKQVIREKRSKIHHLFVKLPPKRTAKFERMVRRNRTLEHEVKVYAEFLKDLQKFIKDRVGDTVQLKIPELYHGYQSVAPEGSEQADSHVLVIEDLAKKGFKTPDWFKHRLTHEEVTLAVDELAKFHACGLAYRMSLKEEIDEKYPYLEDDLYTSNMAKELLAKYLDSYLHFLSLLPGIQEHVLKLRKISNEVFQLLVKLRKPTDPLGTRFNTVCHGDMWMGNLMFKPAGEDAEAETMECTIIDFHSAQFLSPATDLAHLLLTSTTRKYRQKHWDEVIQSYYDTFNRTLAEFGLILRHLGTTYQDFLYEVKRALRGQFLCVAFIIPIGKNQTYFRSLLFNNLKVKIGL